jgi:hypothetical protein
MSWMTKDGSSSALGRSLPHFRLSELARCAVGCPPFEGTSLNCCGFVIEDRGSSQHDEEG